MPANKSPFKRRRREDTGLDDWLMTYADMITLLLCFFALILTLSMPKGAEFQDLQNIMQKRFAGGDGILSGGQGFSAHDEGTEREEGNFKANGIFVMPAPVALQEAPPSLNSPQPEMAGPPPIDISSRELFFTGSADLRPEAYMELDALKPKLNNPVFQDLSVVIEGHSAEAGADETRYPSPWELSASQAAAVARHFIAAGVDASRIRVMGFGDTRPAGGKSVNRVVIRFLP